MGLKFECSNLNFKYSNFNMLISFVFDVVINSILYLKTCCFSNVGLVVL
jgi:hypothetical protein